MAKADGEEELGDQEQEAEEGEVYGEVAADGVAVRWVRPEAEASLPGRLGAFERWSRSDSEAGGTTAKAPDEVERRVDEALDAVGLDASFKPRQPHRLSGGERRAAALATVLAMRPDVLALDEPTNDLDPRARRALIRVLLGFSTRLVASHDLELILDLCQRCVVLDDGRVICEGATREVLADETLMQAHGLEVPLSIRLVSRMK